MYELFRAGINLRLLSFCLSCRFVHFLSFACWLPVQKAGMLWQTAIASNAPAVIMVSMLGLRVGCWQLLFAGSRNRAAGRQERTGKRQGTLGRYACLSSVEPVLEREGRLWAGRGRGHTANEMWSWAAMRRMLSMA